MSAQTSVYGKYILLDRIAVGGMAEVFKAKTFGIHGFERILVIKRILPHLTQDKEFVEMFIDEAKIAVELTHANICQVSDLGKIGNNYFIAMEYINGKDLRAILKKCYTAKKSLSVAQSIYITLETLKGLDYAHRKIDGLTGRSLNLIHRDISPQNVMISYHGEIKIVDFGIAKTESKLHRTQAGVLKGKFGYMSPEQASGLELDQRTDIFSIGILLYEMLTGRRLFHGDSDFKTLEAIKECNIPSPKKYNEDISDELEQILLKILAKEREDRFPNAQEAHAAFSRFFYAAYPEFTSNDLSDFLADLFKTEIAEEQEAFKRILDQLPREDIAMVSNVAQSEQQASHEFSNSKSGRNNTASVVIHGEDEKKPTFLQSKTFGFLILLLTAFGLIFLYLMFFQKKAETTPQQTNALVAQAITITTVPLGATIIIEGEPRGLSPLTVQVLPSKIYDLRIELPGHQPFADQLFIKPDQNNYEFKLSRMENKLGSIFVDSTPPGAKIIFNKTLTDLVTPATIHKLKINEEHEITVEKEGYQQATKSILLKEQTQDAIFNLDKSGANIKINVIPESAEIIFNGKVVENPIGNVEMGKVYDIVLKADGYETETRKVEVTEPLMELDIELKRREVAKGVINISAIPWATVIIDGKKVGSTPILNLTLGIGSHEVVFQHQDFKDVKKTINIKKGDNAPVIIDLRQENGN